MNTISTARSSSAYRSMERVYNALSRQVGVFPEYKTRMNALIEKYNDKAFIRKNLDCI